MPYGILEESGETRRVAVSHSNGYHLVVRVAKPEHLLRGMKPFYFNLFKDDEEDSDAMTHLTYDVPIDSVKELKHKVKKEGKRNGVPSSIYNYLRARAEHQIGVGKDFDEPHEYFHRTETDSEKKMREKLDVIYDDISAVTMKEKNKIMLTEMAKQFGLPVRLPPGIPDYSAIDRKLTVEEVLDDIANRRMVMQSCPLGNSPQAVEEAVDLIALFEGK
jgi:hypothetical protein